MEIVWKKISGSSNHTPYFFSHDENTYVIWKTLIGSLQIVNIQGVAEWQKKPVSQMDKLGLALNNDFHYSCK
jgi:hypothetical protein